MELNELEIFYIKEFDSFDKTKGLHKQVVKFQNHTE